MTTTYTPYYMVPTAGNPSNRDIIRYFTLLDANLASGIGFAGTTTNDNAAAGDIGEYNESVVSNVVAAGTGVFKDATSYALIGGDYDITVAGLIVTQSAVTGDFVVGFSTTSGNSGTGLVYGTSKVAASYPATSNYDVPFCITGRLSISSAGATVYLKYLADYASGTGPQLTGALSWRRRR